jgi:hypothetical protein
MLKPKRTVPAVVNEAIIRLTIRHFGKMLLLFPGSCLANEKIAASPELA